MRHSPRRASIASRPGRPAPLAVAAAVGAAGFATASTLVAQRKTSHFDGRVRRLFPKRRRPVTRNVVHALGYSGKPYVYGPAASLVSWYVSHRGKRHAGKAIDLAASMAAMFSKTLDWMIPHRVAPPGRHSVTEPSYPSGHTLETTAVALTIAYVLWREGMVDGRIVFPVAAVVPVAEGVGRLYLDRHWATDVVGGLLGGVTVAAICAAGYEARR